MEAVALDQVSSLPEIRCGLSSFCDTPMASVAEPSPFAMLTAEIHPL
jgi:hypothetical protein